MKQKGRDMIAIFCALPSEYLNLIRLINCTAIKIISDFANEASAGTLNQTHFAVTKQLGASIVRMITNLTLSEYKLLESFKS